jgi:hypothetical protein
MRSLRDFPASLAFVETDSSSSDVAVSDCTSYVSTSLAGTVVMDLSSVTVTSAVGSEVVLLTVSS